MGSLKLTQFELELMYATYLDAHCTMPHLNASRFSLMENTFISETLKSPPQPVPDLPWWVPRCSAMVGAPMSANHFFQEGRAKIFFKLAPPPPNPGGCSRVVKKGQNRGGWTCFQNQSREGGAGPRRTYFNFDLAPT